VSRIYCRAFWKQLQHFKKITRLHDTLCPSHRWTGGRGPEREEKGKGERQRAKNGAERKGWEEEGMKGSEGDGRTNPKFTPPPNL